MHIVAGITQLFRLAVVVGVVVDRISHPEAKLKFASRAIIGWFDRRPCLQFRVAWERDSRIMDAEMQVYMFVRYQTSEGSRGRRLIEVPLDVARMPVFFLSWNVRHFIDEDSPLWPYLPALGFDASAISAACTVHHTRPRFGEHGGMAQRVVGHASPAAGVVDPSELEILVSFKGDDVVQRETVRAVHSYGLDDILINFDDQRASAALRVLADLATRTQVLFFTHHQHLADLAEEAVSKDRLVRHDLDVLAAPSAASAPA